MASSPQAVQYGFKTVFTRPLVWGAELMWRWVSVFILWVLIIYALFSYLHALPVSDADRFMLSGVVPGLVGEGLRHIFHGSGGRLMKLILLITLSWSFLWWAVSSLGRSATLLGMTEQEADAGKVEAKSLLEAISRIYAMRVALTAASTMAYCGLVALAEAKSRVPVVELHETQGAHTHNSGMFWGITIGLGVVVSLATTSLRWYLSLAPIFCAQYGVGVRDAMRMSMDIAGKRARNLRWVGFVHWAIRLTMNLCLLVPGFTLLGMMARMPRGIAWLMAVVLWMAWSAMGHFMGLAQMASWMRIIAWDEEERNKPPEPVAIPLVMRPLLDPPIVPAM